MSVFWKTVYFAIVACSYVEHITCPFHLVYVPTNIQRVNELLSTLCLKIKHVTARFNKNMSR